MRVDVSSNILEAISWVDRFGSDQIPFAVAAALTDTVRVVSQAETAAIKTAFDSPTPFTQRAVGMTPATKADLKAVVFLKDAQAQYLFNEIEGGKRDVKRFEQRFGAIGGAAVVMPGKGAKLNQYGNISKAQILRIAQDLNSGGTTQRFFKGVPKGTDMPPGIYARVNKNTSIVPLMVFAAQATYKKRFEFSEIAERKVNEIFEQKLLARWEQALRTAR